MRLIPRMSGMSIGLAAGTTAAVVLAASASGYLYSSRHSKSLMANARETAKTQAELIRAGLEYQMLRADRTLIAEMIETFGRQANAERVALLDRKGNVRFSSTPLTSTEDFTPGSSICQSCHQYPPAQRMDSRVIETSGGSLLRTVVPIRNKPECHQCHDARDAINGVLMFDFNMATIRAGMDRDVRWMVLATAGVALPLIVGIGIVIRVVVLRRLRRFEATARAIANGDLAKRVPAAGSDSISWLAREFNTMADSMTTLLEQVNGQQRRLETVINSIDDGIVVLDPKRTIIAANDAFLRRAAGSGDRILGCSCVTAMPGAACKTGDCPTLACVDSGRRQVRICERRTPDGAVRWEEVHASPIFGAGGGLVQVVEVWRDISDRRAAEARLAESHRLASLGLLASGFSHELNTPLGTVLMCVEGILRNARDGAENSAEWKDVGQRASIAREQVMRCRGITQHFLRMSRGQPTPPEIVDLHQTVAHAVRLIGPTARDRSVEIVPPGDGAALHVWAAEAELQHVLINVLLNAIQASRPGGQVAIRIRAGHPMHIQVVDQGCGIAPDNQKRIFEPFFSLRDGGTGLGLFLSLNFVRGWGGDITLESEVGAGSTFTISVPAVGAREQRRAG